MKYFTLERLNYFKKAYHQLIKYKWLSIFVIIASFLASIFEGFSLGAIVPFFQNLTDPGATDTLIFPIFKNLQYSIISGGQESTILKIMIFALVMIMLKSIFNYLRIVASSRTSNLIRRDLQTRLFSATCQSSYKFFNDEIKTGNLISAINLYTRSIIGFYLVLLETISRISRIAIYGILLFLISWKFTLLAIFFEIIIIPLVKKIFSKIKKFSLHATQETIKLNSQIIEKLSNLHLVRIFNTEEYERNNFYKTTTKLATLGYKNDAYHSFIAPITETTAMIALVILFTISIKIFGFNITFYLPFIVAYLYIFMKAFNETNALLKSIAKLFEYIEPYKAYEKVLKEAEDEKMPDGHIKFKKFQNEIKFDNVNFQYEKTKYILKNINLKIKKGYFTAIVGPTGVGKTTIINLIVGLLLPTKGNIFIDDKNIKDLKAGTWRKKIGYISQDIAIFDDSIKNNITYGNFKAKEEEIITATKNAGIHEFIMSLPNKYETIVGERGAKLSGGQKQRIAIARAIIHNPEILILDEATSSLDSETESIVQKSLTKIFKNKTIIAIAHRLATIKKADNILVFENGEILEQGTHDELIKKDGCYKKYYDIQFKN